MAQAEKAASTSRRERIRTAARTWSTLALVTACTAASRSRATRIAGNVEGELKASGDVTIDPTAAIQASIEGSNVSVRGQVTGNVDRQAPADAWGLRPPERRRQGGAAHGRGRRDPQRQRHDVAGEGLAPFRSRPGEREFVRRGRGGAVQGAGDPRRSACSIDGITTVARSARRCPSPSGRSATPAARIWAWSRLRPASRSRQNAGSR